MAIRLLIGDALTVLATLPAESVHCVVTSPPYWGLRDYGVAGQVGIEETPEAFVAVMVEIFREVRRVLRQDGTLWLNLGDSYATGAGKVGNHPGGGVQGDNWHGPTTQPNRMRIAGLKAKDLIGIPWRVAFALQADGWYLRQDIIWAKTNPMPESIKDRCTKAHEYLFLLSKSRRYHFDSAAIAERANNPEGPRQQNTKYQGEYDRTRDERLRTYAGENKIKPSETRNKRSVWSVSRQPFAEAHFATFPPNLVKPCIKAGCPKGGTVLDPFAGAGTTGLVADRLQRNALLIELNPEYVTMARARIARDAGPLFPTISETEATEGTA